MISGPKQRKRVLWSGPSKRGGRGMAEGDAHSIGSFDYVIVGAGTAGLSA